MLEIHLLSDVLQYHVKRDIDLHFFFSPIVIRKWETKPKVYKATVDIDNKDQKLQRNNSIEEWQFEEQMEKSYSNVHLMVDDDQSFMKKHSEMANLKVFPYYRGPGM